MLRIERPDYGKLYTIQRNKYVYAVYYVEGKKVRRSIGTVKILFHYRNGRRRSLEVAENKILKCWRKEREKLLKELRGNLRAREVTSLPDAAGLSGNKLLSVAIEQYLTKYCVGQQTAPGTIQNYKRHLQIFLECIGDRPISTLNVDNVDDLKQFLAKKKLKAETVNGYLRSLNAFFNRAYISEQLSKPIAINMLRPKKKIIKTLPNDKIKAMLTYLTKLRKEYNTEHKQRIRNNYWLIYAFLLSAGCRLGTVLNLKWTTIDIERGRCLAKTKTGEELIPLPSDLLSGLKAHRKRFPNDLWLIDNGKGDKAWKRSKNVSSAFNKLYQSANIERNGATPLHSLRAKTTNVLTEDLGVPPESASHFLGHSDTKTTKAHYMGTREKEVLRVSEIYDKYFLKNMFKL